MSPLSAVASATFITSPDNAVVPPTTPTDTLPAPESIVRVLFASTAPIVTEPSLVVWLVSIVMLAPNVISPVIDTEAPESSEVEIFPFKVTPSLPVTVIVSISVAIIPKATVALPSAEPAFKVTASSDVPVISPAIDIGPPTELTVKSAPSASNKCPATNEIASLEVVNTGAVPVKEIELLPSTAS